MPPRARVALALVSSLLAFSATHASAQTGVLELTGPSECAAALTASNARLASSEQRAATAGLRASVVIETQGNGYRVQVATTRAGALTGETVVLAPTCEEAADVAAVVLALAAGVEGPDKDAPRDAAEPIHAGLERARLEPARGPAMLSTPARPDDRHGSPLFDAALATVRPRRVAVSLGVDAGTLPTPTLVAAAAVAQSFGALELRTALRYGFATVEEELDTGTTESQRREFGALAGLACYGTSGTLRVAACGGAELDLVSRSRHVEHASGLVENQSELAPRLAGTVGGLLAHRGGRIQPELECSGSGVVLGREAGAARLVLRVSAGAAVAF